VDGVSSPISDRRAQTEVVVWEDGTGEDELVVLEPVNLSTQVKRIADFAPVDDHPYVL
jgi:hypothetical protein